MLRIHQKDFSYFTGSNSFYPEKIIKGEPPNTKTRPNKQSAITERTGSKEEDIRRETVMREFVGEYGGGVRQGNVRSKTKELTRTLPCAPSMCPTTIGVSNGLCGHLRACEHEHFQCGDLGSLVKYYHYYYYYI